MGYRVPIDVNSHKISEDIGCKTQKVQYESKEIAIIAEVAIYESLSKKDRMRIKQSFPYKCPICKKWHLTKKQQQE